MVGQRIERLPEPRLLVEFARHIAVKKVCETGDEEDQQRRAESPLMDEIEERRDEQDTEHRQRVRKIEWRNLRIHGVTERCITGLTFEPGSILAMAQTRPRNGK